MHPDRSYRPLHFLALGLAGVCLTVGSLEFLPWLPVGLVGYLLVLMAAHHYAGRAELSEWLANALGLFIGAGATAWIALRSGNEAWAVDVPLLAAMVPYVGPVLMALLCVRLFRPRSPTDFWLLQGLGLLQVMLGCVLATNTLFGLALLAYLSVAAAAAAAYERHVWATRSGMVPEPDPPPPRPAWLMPALGWGLGTAALGLGLFLLSPRLDQPAWDPLSRFGAQRRDNGPSRTGFGGDMDLNRAGDIVADDAAAFWVSVRVRGGRPSDDLPEETHFRGLVLPYYDRGRWAYEENARPRVSESPAPVAEGDLVLKFNVPRQAGGLFVAEPLRLSPTRPGALPIRHTARPREGGVFFESNGTVGTITVSGPEEFQYEQFYDTSGPRNSAPLLRTSDAYLRGLLIGPPPDMEKFARALLLRLGPDDQQWRRELETSPIDLSPRHWRQAAVLLNDYFLHGGEYSYSLSAQRTPKGADPTLYFLTNTRKGPCQHFASALVLLLRSVGVPARAVKGYRRAERVGEGRYVVRQNAAHAWAEAVVATADGDGYEWLSLDPTPAADETAPVPLFQQWLQQGLGGQKFWQELIVNYDVDKQKAVMEQVAAGDYLSWLVWGGAAALGAAAAFVAWRLYWRYRRLVRPGAASLYRRMLRPLRRRGLAPEPGEAPGEFAARAARVLPEAVAGIPAEVVALYYRVRFGGLPEDEFQSRRAEGRLAQLEAAC